MHLTSFFVLRLSVDQFWAVVRALRSSNKTQKYA